MDFNAAQKAAIDTTSGPLLLIAGPGTGKTRVLIAKILKLIESGISPHRILAITFSNKATNEMKDRLALAQADVAEKVEVSTIHAWCSELVRRHAFRLGFEKTPTLMSESQAQLFFRELSPKLPLEGLVKTAQSEPFMDQALELFSTCKDQGLWPEDLIQFGMSSPANAEWEKLGDVYNAFHQFCFSRGFMDFGDAILFCLRLLQDNSEVRAEIQNSYDAILVDEFQDTNWTQVEILRLMSRPDAHICAVGDDDQSIYRFRGASYASFQFFEKAFPHLKAIELNQTYRLSDSIARASSTLIQANGKNRYRPDKKIEALSTETQKSQPVTVLQSSSYEDEAVEVAERIQELLRQGVSPGEIAVLARAHGHMELLADELMRRSIAFRSASSANLWQEPIVQDLMAYLRLLDNPRLSVDLLRLMDSPFVGCSETEIFRFCQWAALRAKSYIEILPDLETSDFPKDFQVKMKSFHENFVSAKAHFARRSLSETIFEFFSQTQIVKKLLDQNDRDLKTLSVFLAQIASWEKLQERREAVNLLPILDRLFKNSGDLEELVTETDPSRVSLLSIHASKGLEFENVFVLSLVGRRFPSIFSKPTWVLPEALQRDLPLTKETHTEEERRLLYVAMTRAKKDLILSTIDKKGTKPSIFVSADLKSSPYILWKEVPARDAGAFIAKPELKIFQRASSVQKAPESSVTAATKQPLRLSFTQLDNYERCPLSYRFRYELKIPTPEAPALAYGTAVHAALEKFFALKKDHRNPSLEDLLRFYETALKEETAKNPNLPEHLGKLGEEQLREFYAKHEGRWPKTIAVEEKFSLRIGEHLVVGKIDRADSTPEGISIVDYKTGRAKSSDSEKDQRFAEDSLQFSIYSLAAREHFKWNLASLKFYYLSDQTELSTHRSLAQDSETKTRILSIASAIQNKDFPAKPQPHQCRHCEYASICPSALT